MKKFTAIGGRAIAPRQKISDQYDYSVCIFLTATFDIQSFTAERNDSGITVTGEFITGSLAKGCLIVLQCNKSTTDTYRALIRNGWEQTLSEAIGVSSCTYTVYAYDIEDDGLPYEMPVNTPENGQNLITITTNCKYVHACIYK